MLRRIWRRIALATLAPDARAIVNDRLTYLGAGKIRRIEDAVRRVDAAGVTGDFVEFGVALGGSGILLARRAGSRRRFHGLDVFGLIPPPTPPKDGPESTQRYDVIAAGRSTGLGGDTYYGYRENLFAEVEASFRRHDVPVDGDRVQLHKGLFEDTWPALNIQKIALAHIDCDWYDPCRFCLEAVADRVPAGGILILDDYHTYSGCRAATDEFTVAHPWFSFEDGPNPFLVRQSVS
ncbi:MAG: TylF/MycF/NovP-related O-methyltransferase [Parvibaculaceae bacterium]